MLDEKYYVLNAKGEFLTSIFKIFMLRFLRHHFFSEPRFYRQNYRFLNFALILFHIEFIFEKLFTPKTLVKVLWYRVTGFFF